MNITNDLMTHDPKTTRVVLKRPPPTQCQALNVMSYKCISVTRAARAAAWGSKALHGSMSSCNGTCVVVDTPVWIRHATCGQPMHMSASCLYNYMHGGSRHNRHNSSLIYNKHSNNCIWVTPRQIRAFHLISNISPLKLLYTANAQTKRSSIK